VATQGQIGKPPIGAIHYGGSLNPKSGRIGPKPKQGAQFRTLRRYEAIVRLENAGFTPQAIAPMLGISVARLKYIIQHPDYLNTRIKITHGIILDSEGSVAQILSQRREMLTQMLPAALQILANELQSQGTTLAERKHKTALAQDILDREGLFAKISKTEIKPVDAWDYEEADKTSRELLNVIKGVAAPLSGAHSVLAMEANKEFSNSHTLSAIDQQKALDTLEEASRTEEFERTLLEALPVDGTVN